jgi:hypothetical protein
MAIFKCNLSHTKIKGMQFINGVYETEDRTEIAFLRAYGGQQGCLVTEEKTQEPIKPARGKGRRIQ